MPNASMSKQRPLQFLCSADPAGTHKGLAARLFRCALGQQHSWVQEIANHMRDCGIHAPHAWGVLPAAQEAPWLSRDVAVCARPCIGMLLMLVVLKSRPCRRLVFSVSAIQAELLYKCS